MTDSPQQFEPSNKVERKKLLDSFNRSSNAGAMLKLALLQMVSTLAFSGGMFYCFGVAEALSALFGGSIAALMSVFMASRMFTTHRLASSREMAPNERLARFYAAALLKVVFTLMMMGILIVVIKVSMLPFIIAYLIAAVLVNLCFLLITDA